MGGGKAAGGETGLQAVQTLLFRQVRRLNGSVLRRLGAYDHRGELQQRAISLLNKFMPATGKAAPDANLVRVSRPSRK